MRNIQKKSFYQAYVGKGIRRTQMLQRGYLFAMFAIILHDSFVHGLPFYYILFALAGLLVERAYTATRKIEFDDSAGQMRERPGLAWLFVIAVLALRVPFGDWALPKIHVVWFSDALYLFSLGLHFARLRSISRQIDELVYGYMVRLKSGEDPPPQQSDSDSDGTSGQ